MDQKGIKKGQTYCKRRGKKGREKEEGKGKIVEGWRYERQKRKGGKRKRKKRENIHWKSKRERKKK